MDDYSDIIVVGSAVTVMVEAFCPTWTMELLQRYVLVLIVGFLPLSYCDEVAGPIFNTNLGRIQGSVLKSDGGLEFFAFRGIPYVKPPVKELRFEAPQALNEKWDGVLDATEDGNICIQDDLFTQVLMGDEDCLYLNVYTPKAEDQEFSTPLAVMVFIHGGGFLSGTGASSYYGPQRLMDKRGIILVTINYRLGPFGFLTTLDENAPGNNGMLDQVMALRWIRDNIADFGGNPNQVTIFGESAGSASVGLHMVSPLSKGLFHAGIAQSGSFLSEWATMIEDNVSLNYTKELASMLKCPTECHRAMLKCLKRLPSVDIIFKTAQQTKIHMRDDSFMIIFKPVVDLTSRGENAFLPDAPHKLLANKRFHSVPMLAGVTKDEAIILMDMWPGSGKLIFHDQDSLSVYLRSFALSLLENEEQWKRTSQDIMSSYLQNVDDANETQRLVAITNMITDGFMTYKMDVMNKILASYDVPSYAYKLTYSGEHTIALNGPKGMVAHCDDLQYLFHCSYFKSTVLSDNDKRMADVILTLWTNFAKTGVPSLEGSVENHPKFKWEPVTPSSYKYLDLNLKPAMVDGYLSTNYAVWEHAYSGSPKDEL